MVEFSIHKIINCLDKENNGDHGCNRYEDALSYSITLVDILLSMPCKTLPEVKILMP